MIYVRNAHWSTKNWKRFVTQWWTAKLNCSKHWWDSSNGVHAMACAVSDFTSRPSYDFHIDWREWHLRKNEFICDARLLDRALGTGPLQWQWAMDSCGSDKYAQQPTPTQSNAWWGKFCFSFYFILWVRIYEVPLWIFEWGNLAARRLAQGDTFLCSSEFHSCRSLIQ